ncbi:RNase H domain-containing protein [Trichonephila clavipes]|nr:RNase H domain-containing protein [Trichonephila clavipes]
MEDKFEIRSHIIWIPSHKDLEGNEIVDILAKSGACEVSEPSAPLSFLEIFSRTKHQNKTAWITPPPEHHWYQCSCPAGSLSHGFTRQDQTLLARFGSGHIKTRKFSKGCKSFEMCTNCSSEPATPAHILECLGLTKQDLADDPLLVLDFLKVYDVIDLV